MTGADLVGALAPVAQALEALRVPYFISGSLASSMHGVARASLDVDLVADLRPEHVDRFAAALGDSYYLDPDRIRSAIRLRLSFNVIHLATMFKVDVFVSKGRPFDDAALGRVQPETLEESPTARTFPVASAEDIILAKLDWFKAGGESSERQWSDVLGVIKASSHRLQVDYLRTSAQKLGVADLLERAIRDAAGPQGR